MKTNHFLLLINHVFSDSLYNINDLNKDEINIGQWIMEFHEGILKPERKIIFKNLSKRFDGIFNFATVDCEKSVKLCSQLKVNYLPSMLHIANGEVDTNVYREVDGELSFDKIESSVKVLQYKMDLNDFDSHSSINKDFQYYKTKGLVMPLNENFYSQDYTRILPEKFGSGTWIIKYHSPDCIHCLNLAPLFSTLAYQFKGKIGFAELNIRYKPLIGQIHAPRGTPLLQVYENGKPTQSLLGFRPMNILKKFIEPLATPMATQLQLDKFLDKVKLDKPFFVVFQSLEQPALSFLNKTQIAFKGLKLPEDQLYYLNLDKSFISELKEHLGLPKNEFDSLVSCTGQENIKLVDNIPEEISIYENSDNMSKMINIMRNKMVIDPSKEKDESWFKDTLKTLTVLVVNKNNKSKSKLAKRLISNFFVDSNSKNKYHEIPLIVQTTPELFNKYYVPLGLPKMRIDKAIIILDHEKSLFYDKTFKGKLITRINFGSVVKDIFSGKMASKGMFFSTSVRYEGYNYPTISTSVRTFPIWPLWVVVISCVLYTFFKRSRFFHQKTL